MLQRSKSAVFVVIVGLVPAILGGPLFAAVFAGIAMATYYEFVAMCGLAETLAARIGYVSLLGFASVALLTRSEAAFHAALVFALIAPIAALLPEPIDANRLTEWAIATGATLYLGLPAFAAIWLRGVEGQSEHGWINSVADVLNPRNTETSAGLGWFLFTLLVIWLSDTFAYLVGRQIGRVKLIPHVSPNKTVEGAVGGLVAAAMTGSLCVWVLGMEISPAAGFGLGAGVAIAGMIGDLIESMIKRQVGVKDSGTLIPGHGGVFDRIDALLLGLLVVWVAVPWLN